MTANWITKQLEQYGPGATGSVRPSLAAADTYCRRLARRHYENFVVASLLLPRIARRDFHRIYAYCRWADDLADEMSDPQQSLELLQWWQDELRRCYQGKAIHPVFVALSETNERLQIPEHPFSELLAAFRQDQTVTHYATFDDLLAYCSRSANPVGHIVLYLGRCYNEANVYWSDQICTGLQLPNFWQDVARDHDRGRIYVPQEDLDRFGCGQQPFLERRCTDAFRRMMQFQVERAQSFLRAGQPLVDNVPRWLQVDIDLFIRGGLATLQAIRGVDYDVWQSRPKVRRIHQAWLWTMTTLRHKLGFHKNHSDDLSP